jgi:hypothetical protein
MVNIVNANPRTNDDVVMQGHIEKVKRTNPKKCQAMIDRAGGDINSCGSCHVEVEMKNEGGGKKNHR